MSHDTLIHRLVRPVVRAARPLGVTPDQVTVARLVTGLAAAAMFSAGPGPVMDAGAAVFLLSALLDRADGELARQSGRASPHGRLFDLWSDGVATIAGFLGLGWGLAASMGGAAPWLGLAAGGATAAVFAVLTGEGCAAPPILITRRGVVVDPDDAMLLLAPLIWLDLAAPALVLAAVLTPLVALALARRRGRVRQPAAAG